MDFLLGGIPRGGTTIAAKFFSLHNDIFCYAGETHIIPLLNDIVGQTPCLTERVDDIAEYLQQQLMTTMVTMPRYNVERGAHPGNLIFDEKIVQEIVCDIKEHLKRGFHGEKLYLAALGIMREAMQSKISRPILGEKTPNNLFSLSEYGSKDGILAAVVVREPYGVLRSMRKRVEAKDSFSSAFRGNIELNLGIYLIYADAAIRTMSKCPSSLLVRFEDMAKDPAEVVRRMHGVFGRKPDERVINFVENANDPEIADLAPMRYKRLEMHCNKGDFTPIEVWKIATFTKRVREAFGYTDEFLADMGWKIPADWPGGEIPAVILPMTGFHPSSNWMKQRGTFVAYIPKGLHATIHFSLWSHFPEHVTHDPVQLTVTVNDEVVDVVLVSCGPRETKIKIPVNDKDNIPLGTQGSYAIIGLRSSVSYSPLGATKSGASPEQISFLVKKASVVTELGHRDKKILFNNIGGIKDQLKKQVKSWLIQVKH